MSYIVTMAEYIDGYIAGERVVANMIYSDVICAGVTAQRGDEYSWSVRESGRSGDCCYKYAQEAADTTRRCGLAVVYLFPSC